MFAVALGLGCQGRDDLDGKRRPLAGLTEPGRDFSVDVGDRKVAYDLYDNRAVAVVHVGGKLVIDCGTADFAKYAEGRYRARWHLGVDYGGERASLVDGLGGELYFPIDGDSGGIARARDGSLQISLRARPAKGRQLVSVLLNEHRLGDITMPVAEWDSYSIRAPAATVRPGENKLRFFFRHTGEIEGHRSAAALASIAIGEGPGAGQKGLRTASVTRGGQRMAALRVTAGSRLSYYLRVPERAPELVFAVAGSGAVAVQIASARSSASRLWEGVASAEWAATRVDLNEHAGEVVRLDLVAAKAVDWGRPRVVVAPPAAPANPQVALGRAAAPRLADHVIIWVVSALRADRFIGDEGTSGFARIADRGTSFVHATATSSAPGPAHASMLTGRYPESGRIGASAKTLAERFREAGYATALISGNGFVNDEAGFERGFDHYDNPMRRRHPFSARILWQKARRILTNHRDGHSLIYIATVEPHLPYSPSVDSLAAEWSGEAMRFGPADTAALSDAVRNGEERLTVEERRYIEALYDAEVRDGSLAVGEMLADLDKLGLSERTAVILVGDHGEELWERGNFGHGASLFEEVLHVPLVVVAPGQATARLDQSDVELIDVYATALAAAGISANAESQGRSLIATAAADDDVMGLPVYSHLPGWGRSLRLGRHKLIVPLRGATQVFDLATDARERVNSYGEQPIVDRYLRNVFSIGVAYQSAWTRQRWGTASNMKAAFAADHGL